MRAHETLNKFQSLRQLFADLLALGVIHRLFELGIQRVQLNLREQHLDRFCTHSCNECIAILLLGFAIFLLIEQLRFLQLCLPRVDDDIILVINDSLQLTRTHIQHQPDAGGHAFIKPDMRNGYGKLDMPHPLAAHT
jgi:hypothetical protein